MRKSAPAIAAASLALGLSSCTADDADVVSDNISKAADNFEVARRIVMFNGDHRRVPARGGGPVQHRRPGQAA